MSLLKMGAFLFKEKHFSSTHRKGWYVSTTQFMTHCSNDGAETTKASIDLLGTSICTSDAGGFFSPVCTA
jgi:hypothetical protein